MLLAWLEETADDERIAVLGCVERLSKDPVFTLLDSTDATHETEELLGRIGLELELLCV